MCYFDHTKFLENRKWLQQKKQKNQKHLQLWNHCSLMESNQTFMVDCISPKLTLSSTLLDVEFLFILPKRKNRNWYLSRTKANTYQPLVKNFFHLFETNFVKTMFPKEISKELVSRNISMNFDFMILFCSISIFKP